MRSGCISAGYLLVDVARKLFGLPAGSSLAWGAGSFDGVCSELRLIERVHQFLLSAA